MNEEIEAKVEELYHQFVQDKVFIPSPHCMVCMNEDVLRNMIRLIFTTRERVNLLEASSDKDAVADLEILLWEIKQEKEK